MQPQRNLTFSRRAALCSAIAAAALPAITQAFPAGAAQPFQYPLAATLDPAGAIYVVDLLLPGVWKVEEGKATAFHQAKKKFREPLYHPRAVLAIEKDVLVVTDTAARDIFLVKSSEPPRGLTGGKLDVPAAIAQMDDAIYVADTERNEIWKGGAASDWSKWADVPAPRGLAFDSEKRLLIVSGRDNVLYRIAKEGDKPEKLAQGVATGYWNSIALGADGAPVIVDSYAQTLWKIEGAKPVEWVKGEPFDHPVSITRRGDGFLVTDSRAKSLVEVDASGKAKTMTVEGA